MRPEIITLSDITQENSDPDGFTRMWDKSSKQEMNKKNRLTHTDDR